MKRSLWVLWLGLLGLPFIFGQVAVQAEPKAVESDPIWSGSAPGTAVTNNGNTPQGARGPDIAAAPNGNELMIVYERQLDEGPVNTSFDHDIYYRASTNGGNSWSAPAAVFTSGNADSIQASVAYTNNRAYVIWVERPNGGGNDILRVRSRSIGGGNWSNVGSNGRIASGSKIIDPTLFVSGSTVHVAWGQQSGTGEITLRHARRSGGNWIISNVSPASFADVFSPSLVVSASGFIHIAWQGQDEESFPPRSIIRYARGQASNNTTTWTTSRTLSSVNEDYVNPAINQTPSGLLEVAYTRQQASSNPLLPDLQDVYYRSCAGSCLNMSNWSVASPITSLHSVNDALPFFLIPTIANDSCGNSYVYYHGGSPGDNNPQERIYGVNRGSGWNSALADDSVSAANSRAVNPAITTTLGKMHIVYQQIVNSNKSQLYYRQGATVCALYLPFISR